jgi:hypothetical protein
MVYLALNISQRLLRFQLPSWIPQEESQDPVPFSTRHRTYKCLHEATRVDKELADILETDEEGSVFSDKLIGSMLKAIE